MIVDRKPVVYEINIAIDVVYDFIIFVGTW